jgi:hypothetical protein
MQIKPFMLVGATIVCAATSIYSLNAFAEEKTGQDYPNEKCELIKKDGSSTTGQCSNVCKDLEVGKKDDAGSGLRTCKEQ